MNRIDQLIEQALSAEDQALLQQHVEPGYLAQAFGLFRGPWAWVVWLVNAATLLAFAGALYAGWQVYVAVDALLAVKWGVLALLLFQAMGISKTFMGMHLETSRMLREVKRVELQMSLLRPLA